MKQLYIAYGSNMHMEQMRRRCPKAKPIGSAELNGYKLQFNGVATIIPSEYETVPVAVWEITEECEKALDSYEGFPYHYRKEYVEIEIYGKKQEAMVYIINNDRKSPPSTYYYNVIEEGYTDFNINLKPLRKALNEANDYYMENYHTNW